MKTWEKNLRAAQATEQAAAYAADQEKQWGEYGRAVAEARMTKTITTTKAHWEIQTMTQMVTLPGKKVTRHTAGGDEITIREYNDVKCVKGRRAVEMTRTRVEHFKRIGIPNMAKYKLALTKVEFTHEIVLTNAQRAVIESLVLGQDWGKIMCGLRRVDTGATALYIRHENQHMVLFEDGSAIKSYNVSEFGANPDWFFNTKVKRTTATKIETTVKATKVDGGVRIR